MSRRGKKHRNANAFRAFLTKYWRKSAHKNRIGFDSPRLSGIVGIFMIAFGIVWIVITTQINGIFSLFGVVWCIIAVVITVYNFKNATGKNRYSQFDITDENEEPDPLNERFRPAERSYAKRDFSENKFCPYCGCATKSDFEFCNNCGKRLP